MSFKLVSLILRNETNWIDGREQRVLEVIIDKLNKDGSGICCLSHKTIAARAKVSVSTVQRAISGLVKKSIILKVGYNTDYQTVEYIANVIEIKKAFEAAEVIRKEKANKHKNNILIHKLVSTASVTMTGPSVTMTDNHSNTELYDYHGGEPPVDNLERQNISHDFNKKTNIRPALVGDETVVEHILIKFGWKPNDAFAVVSLYPLFEFFLIFERMHASKRPIKNKGGYVRSCLRKIENKYKSSKACR